MIKLSVVIVAFNEEKDIEKCLNSASDVADEIVVVDSLSTDRTPEICKKYGVNFISHPWEGYVNQKNYALKKAKGDKKKAKLFLTTVMKTIEGKKTQEETWKKMLEKQAFEQDEKRYIAYYGHARQERLIDYCVEILKRGRDQIV